MIHCRFENGNETDQLRHLVADIVCLRGDEVLMVKRADHLVEGGKWALPGGFMDRDETIAECARREFLEETGYACSNLRLVDLCSRPQRRNDDRQNVSAVFLVDIGERTQAPDDECSDMRWFPVADVVDDVTVAFGHERFIAAAVKYRDTGAQVPTLDGEQLSASEP
jgi:ADP-ribose pyrophosphatase YjhB (NUDIX family)